MMVTIGITRNVQRVIQTKVVISRFSINDAALRDHDEDFDQKSVQNISQKQNKKNIQNITPDKSNDNNDDDAGDDDNDNNKSIGVGY